MLNVHWKCKCYIQISNFVNKWNVNIIQFVLQIFYFNMIIPNVTSTSRQCFLAIFECLNGSISREVIRCSAFTEHEFLKWNRLLGEKLFNMVFSAYLISLVRVLIMIIVYSAAEKIPLRHSKKIYVVVITLFLTLLQMLSDWRL